MVGIAVSMLVGLAAAGSAIMFTASQRQGVGASGSGMGGASAISALKNDVALAGLGFFGDANYLCHQLSLSVNAAVLSDGAPFVPLRITAGANDDSIDVVYGERVESGANVLLDVASDGTSAELLSLLPVAVGQAVLLAPAAAGGTCLVRSVTAVTPSTVDDPQILSFAGTGQHNQAAFSVAPAFAMRDRITLLGEVNWNRYRREGNTLLMDRPMLGTTVVIARNVIRLRAQYGIAAVAAGSTTLEQWQDATGTFANLNGATLPRVRAVRLGLVIRSPQREKPDASGNCEASQAKPQLFGVEVEPDVADWQCYRFLAATVVVPLRNLVLGLRP